MTGQLLAPPDLSAFTSCGYVCYRLSGIPHRCDRRAVASAIGPNGERVSLCALHERTALAALPRYDGWAVQR